jgi:hypothetical protein
VLQVQIDIGPKKNSDLQHRHFLNFVLKKYTIFASLHYSKKLTQIYSGLNSHDDEHEVFYLHTNYHKYENAVRKSSRFSQLYEEQKKD